jgi:hypothetical protein
MGMSKTVSLPEKLSMGGQYVHNRLTGRPTSLTLEIALGERPPGLPLPKDSVLAELSGWYERWSLTATELYRGQSELAGKLGLSPGRAPRRLRKRNPAARAREAKRVVS